MRHTSEGYQKLLLTTTRVYTLHVLITIIHARTAFKEGMTLYLKGAQAEC